MSTITYTVTVASAKFLIDSAVAPKLTFRDGDTYEFDQADSSNSGHILQFSITSNNSGGAEYTTGVTKTGTPGSAGAKTTIITSTSTTDTLYYYSSGGGTYGEEFSNSGFTTTSKNLLKPIVGAESTAEKWGAMINHTIEQIDSITLANPTITSFQYSDGAAATAEKTVATVISCTTQTSTTVLVPGVTSAIIVGQVVSGVGVPLGATVVSIVTDTSFVLSSAATASATVNLTFGGVVTITGASFDSVLGGDSSNIAVTFDGTSATSISVNALKTIITCTPPAHAAGTITLKITNDSGLTASTDFIYDIEPIFTTAAGSLGSFVDATYTANADAPRIQGTENSVALTTGFQRVTSASDDTVITSTIQGLTVLTSGYLTGTLSATAGTTYPFYATAMDNENQRTAPRLFNIISSYPATGGTITTYTGFVVHTFLIADTGQSFTPLSSFNVDYLIVAGGAGGGGGNGTPGGGGGAGGFLTAATYAVTAQAYVITVGPGGGSGASGAGFTGVNGGDSVINPASGSAITATGGGGGARDNTAGSAGGSGGGGSYSGAGGSGVSGQGSAGGAGLASGAQLSGGGGGASAVGVGGAGTAGGAGGAGTANSYRTGSAVTYAGGGGGSYNTGGSVGAGGAGGGGVGTHNGDGTGGFGTADTGGGGGGAGGNVSAGGTGGTGIVVIRYAI